MAKNTKDKDKERNMHTRYLFKVQQESNFEEVSSFRFTPFFIVSFIASILVIIVISANDHLKDRKYDNKNTISVNENLYKVSSELNLAFWDFYTIMGGEHSINEWHKKGLTGEDKLHFKKSCKNLL